MRNVCFFITVLRSQFPRLYLKLSNFLQVLGHKWHFLKIFTHISWIARTIDRKPQERFGWSTPIDASKPNSTDDEPINCERSSSSSTHNDTTIAYYYLYFIYLLLFSSSRTRTMTAQRTSKIKLLYKQPSDPNRSQTNTKLAKCFRYRINVPHSVNSFHFARCCCVYARDANTIYFFFFFISYILCIHVRIWMMIICAQHTQRATVTVYRRICLHTYRYSFMRRVRMREWRESEQK